MSSRLSPKQKSPNQRLPSQLLPSQSLSSKPLPTPAVQHAAPPKHATHPEHGSESMEDFSAALEAFEREQAAEAAAVEAYGDKVVSGTVSSRPISTW